MTGVSVFGVPASKSAEYAHVLVTGGAGFIGSNLVHLLNREYPATQVTVLDDLSTGLESNLRGASCQLVVGSITDFDLTSGLAESVTSIVHLGALGSVPRSVGNPRASYEVNSLGTLNILEAARKHGVPHVVVASSSSVYGSNPTSPKSEQDWTVPLSPYGASKLSAESLALSYASTYGLGVLALRFFNVYGPGQTAGHDYAAVIPKFISAALSDKPLTLHGDGSQSRDFTFVASIAETLAEACMRGITHDRPVNTAFGGNTSLVELIAVLERVLGRKLEVDYQEARAGDVFSSRADPGLFLELFPSARSRSLSEGVRATVEWFRARNTIS